MTDEEYQQKLLEIIKKLYEEQLKLHPEMYRTPNN